MTARDLSLTAMMEMPEMVMAATITVKSKKDGIVKAGPASRLALVFLMPLQDHLCL